MTTQLTIPDAEKFQKIERVTENDLLQYALQHDAAIDVIERFAALKERADNRREEREFTAALRAAQEEIPAIEPNKKVMNGNKLMFAYATYEKLDEVIRPIYLRHGLSVSFNGAEAPEGKVRVLCRVFHSGGHSEPYQFDLAIDPGKVGLSRTDAELAAQSKAKRRLLRNIFNIVDDGEDELLTNRELMEAIEKIEDAGDMNIVMHYYKEAYKVFESNPDAIKAIVQAKNKRQKELAK